MPTESMGQINIDNIKTKQDAVSAVLGLLHLDNLTPDDLVLIHGLLLEHREDELYDKQLQKEFNSFLKYDPNPGLEARQALEELKKRLGIPTEKKRMKLFSRKVIINIAAVLIPFIMVAGGFFLFMNRADICPDYITVTASPDSSNEITLPDNSVVKLSENSILDYAENFAKNRKLKLTGEAFFSVIKDENHPFVVETEDVTVKVLGTEFNIKALPENTQTIVSLASGLIEVKCGNEIHVLEPMSQLTYDKAMDKSEINSLANTLVKRWKTGQQKLQSVPLAEAMRIIADFYDKKLVMEREPNGKADISIVLRADKTAAEILDMVRFIRDSFTYTISGDTIYIKPHNN